MSFLRTGLTMYLPWIFAMFWNIVESYLGSTYVSLSHFPHPYLVSCFLCMYPNLHIDYSLSLICNTTSKFIACFFLISAMHILLMLIFCFTKSSEQRIWAEFFSLFSHHCSCLLISFHKSCVSAKYISKELVLSKGLTLCNCL